jgi:hypothetical protein
LIEAQTAPLPTSAMIDLRSSNEALSKYTERYDHLLPPLSLQLRQRMDYMLRPDAPQVPNEKPARLSSRPCTLTQEQALDRYFRQLL